MVKSWLTLAAALVVGVGVAASSAPASAASVRIGTLTCTLTGDSNKVIYSTQSFDCDFAPTSGPRENYEGQIRQIGVNLEFTNTLTLVWAVLAPANPSAAGVLAGTYVGAAASASVGIGVGGKVLVGGSDKSISLQPVSVSGSTGGGADIGVERFTLEYRP
ncbi:MAG: DUF992 domain-containing protein [Pseudomonadota bacterium]